VDYLTFVPDGEPTLDLNLGAAIDGLRDLGLPIAVISNASLIWREAVRAALTRADWVSVKVDSVHEPAWRSINRPHEALELDRILEGIRDFARAHAGVLVSETMLVRDINDGEAAVEDLGRFLAGAGIRRACLSLPIRPTAVPGMRGPEEAVLTRAHRQLADRGIEVELLSGYEGDAIAFGGDLEQELLALTAVHPLRQSALAALLAKAGADEGVVEQLLRDGRLKRVLHAGETFYVRRRDRPPGR
jgi:wyosine [tRNA(Phe)-imidazoG37] synthetase (radical SAM superfamily)